MQHFEQLIRGKFYHIYNHGVGGQNLFRESDNFEYFLIKYDQYISPIAETYAWVLMPNHFHLLVKIKDEADIANDVPKDSKTPLHLKPPHQHFSNLFNAYTKAFNKRYNLRGALFERPFKRKLVDTAEYLKRVILYIHNNPVHHNFCSHPVEYPWNSYLTCVSIKPTKLKRNEVIGWFDNQANFKHMHNNKIEVESIEEWLEI